MDATLKSIDYNVAMTSVALLIIIIIIIVIIIMCLYSQCIGDVTDSALLKCVELSIGNVAEFRAANKQCYEVPFNSTDEYQVCH